MAKQNLKVLWRDIKASPAILITLVVIAIFIIYYVYKQNNAAIGGTPVATTGTPTALYEIATTGYTPPIDGEGTGSPTGSGNGGTGSGTGGAGGATGGGSIVGKVFSTTKAGSLEDNPRGKVLETVPSGGQITVLTKTTKPDPGGSSKVYYWVNYNGKHGWFGSDNFNVGS